MLFGEGSPSGMCRSHQGPAERSAADQAASWIRFLPVGAGCFRGFREETAALRYYPSLPGGLASSSCQNKPSRKKTNKQLMTSSIESFAASAAGGTLTLRRPECPCRVLAVDPESFTHRDTEAWPSSNPGPFRGAQSLQRPTSSAPCDMPYETR